MACRHFLRSSAPRIPHRKTGSSRQMCGAIPLTSLSFSRNEKETDNAPASIHFRLGTSNRCHGCRWTQLGTVPGSQGGGAWPFDPSRAIISPWAFR